MEDKMQQQYYNQQVQDQQTQVRYDEPEYLIRPTWKLAWGLLWRMMIIQAAIVLPIYLIIFVMAV